MNHRVQLDRLLVTHEVAAEGYRQAREGLTDADGELDNAVDAQTIIQTVSQAIQEQVHEKISGVVTRCLEYVFDDPYAFAIRFDLKRGKTDAVLTFTRDGLELENPLREIGGGVIDVASFALRLACLMVSRPALRRVLVLDEPFSKIRGELNRERVRDLVRTLSEELNVQFILNVDTDVYPEFELGKVVRLDGQ